jgi:4-amino-4-deoxy-L-arabinose transferase-like glycosyltransferase
MVIKFLIAGVGLVIVVSLSWYLGMWLSDRRRLRQWEMTERTRAFAKKKAKRVQEAVDVLYNEIDEIEEES